MMHFFSQKVALEIFLLLAKFNFKYLNHETFDELLVTL